MKIVWILLLSMLVASNADQGFDVRQHLSTVTRYDAVKDVAQNLFEPSEVPRDCTPIHLNLVARHGTRSPTKKRLRELENLAVRFKELVKDAEGRNSPLHKIPGWLREWESPWKGKVKGGELISLGEEELYRLGIQVRERFPNLFEDDYHPDVYMIRATQIPRASASAVAFGMGLFSGRGKLGPGQNRAFAVTSENRASDTKLRFFECCQNYKSYRKSKEPAVDKLKEPVLYEITAAVAKRYDINFTKQDISSLWFLCKQEASLLNVTDQACALFTPSEVALLEWTDDLEVFILKGYGNSLNYRMGAPLLQDVLHSMEEAVKARKEKLPSGSYEKARLRFAHAETVVPFSCLLGLFLDGSDFEKIKKEQPLELPTKPPKSRNFRGRTMAPFGGNNMLVLYSCPADSSSANYFVQVLHNEQPIPLPGCDGKDFCPLEVFKERIVEPHLKHDFDILCNAKPDGQPASSTLSLLYGWLFGSRNGDTEL
ncbi:PREDICTED: multiple inositol polyphosphate phosphatase 1-like [Tarenaya hassleriana]|uniref:multiple inositol polyphosphate phosphatase 1-like n=1 Tax=Tarenaya hassleriana TaxID=28532 RepID=UPI00053C8B39|nr:PREDICTED: multiple inositol polyphosphate phosphatase 1-like [Tarenaya hassleriana]